MATAGVQVISERPAHNQDREPQRGLCFLPRLLPPGPASLSLRLSLVQVTLAPVPEVSNIAHHGLGEDLLQQRELQAQCQHPSLTN